MHSLYLKKCEREFFFFCSLFVPICINIIYCVIVIQKSHFVFSFDQAHFVIGVSRVPFQSLEKKKYVNIQIVMIILQRFIII